MLPRRTRITRKGRTCAAWRAVAATLALAACAGPTLRDAPPSHLQPWRQALAELGDVRVLASPGPKAPFDVTPGATLVVVDESWRTPDGAADGVLCRALHDFVHAGGRLVLFGYAAQLAVDVGAEAEVPECAPFRWGFDARTAMGRARLGFRVVSGRMPELFEDLPAVEGREHTYFVTGGQPCNVPLCAWSVGAPQSGQVLANLATELDGQPASDGGAAVVQWRVGRGHVLACGLLPDLGNGDDAVRDTARAFVRRCAAGGKGRPPGDIVLLRVDPRGPAAEAATAPSEPNVPRAPLLAHWGWQATLHDPDPSRVRSPDELLGDVLVPSWLAGADLLELDLADAARGVPLAWSPDDPLKRPASWRGDVVLPTWNRGAFARVATEAHARGMLVDAAVDPLPVGERATERLVALRFLARELACVRRLGPGALDGLGVRQWWPDAGGYGASMWQDFHPAGFLYRSGELVPELAGSLRALDADDGVPLGATLAGVSSRWRDGFPADLFPLGVLDARERTGVDAAAVAAGGGSHADWLVTQVNDFVRARAGRGASLWWRRHDDATLGADTQAYVHGLSLEPLRAAVAMGLASTGSDGRRAAAASLVDGVGAGFGAEVPVPAAVHALQNNWLRLLGSGGALSFDPQGLARFRANEPLLVSQSFLRTRLFGGRPDGGALRAESLDLLADGQRGEGGYGTTTLVGSSRAADRRAPAILAAGDAPRWPAAAIFELAVSPGCHEVEILLRSVRGSGVLELSLDGVVLRCLPFRSGERAEPVVVPLHVARPGSRQLRLAVVDRGAVALDRLRLVRSADVGVEAQVVVPAGACARLQERSCSSYHAETVELAAIADMAGFLVRIACERASRNLQVERTFSLPEHRELAAAAPGETAEGLRQPFVLRARNAAWPDLVVVPLMLARHEKLVLRDGELVLHQAPEAGMQSRIAFLFSGRAESDLWRQHAAAVFADVERPPLLDLGDAGEATLVSSVPLPWTRVVHVEGNAATPFFVREQGWWRWRGSQPATDGGRWLRVEQAPQDTVQVVGGAAVFARTRPGPGSLHVVALRDPEPASATARVLQPSRLTAPSVVFAKDFDEVWIDGAPWAWCDGRTVYLPDRVGTFRIETRTHGGPQTPAVRCTRAPLEECRWVPERRELVLRTAADASRPPELPWTAVLRGPVPVHVDNGEVVDEASLRHADAEAAALARAGGVLVRFKSGVTRIVYGQ